LMGADGNPTDESALFLAGNRNKQSITVDFTKPGGADILRDLAARCDVMVENYKPSVLQKYGLDYDAIKAINPNIIYCSVTGFGGGGPYAGRPAYDFILQGMAGLMSTCGQPDGTPGGAPLRTAIPITDVVTALYATI